MKNKKCFYIVIMFFSLVVPLFSQDKDVDDFEKTLVMNSASNKDNTLILLNTIKEDKWKSVIYAYFPKNGDNDCRIVKLWDKVNSSGSVRSLIYSPYSDNFYFYSAWDNENENLQGLYIIPSKRINSPYELQIDYKNSEAGLSYFLMNKKGIWLIKDIPEWNLSEKEKVPDYNYPWSFAYIYQIENENGYFFNNIPENAVQIKAMSYWRAENIPGQYNDTKGVYGNVSYIFQTTDYCLLIRDIDNSSWWIYNCDTHEASKFNTYEEAKQIATAYDKKIEKQEYRKEHYSLIFFILLIVASIIIISLLIYVLIKNLRIHINEDEKIKERNRMIFEIQEKERAKISRDIHDSVVQDIRVIRLETENLVVDEKSKQKQTKIEDIATDCIIKLRNICYNLTPAELTIHKNNNSSEFELISIINSLVQQFISRTHLPCVFKVEEGFEYPVLNRDITQNLFRVIQEALTNIEKHSYATQVSIYIKKDNNNLLIYVTDDGIGCNPDELQKKIKRKEHLGLRSMIDRMDLIGGEIEFLTAQDDGMEVKITLPLDKLKK